VRTVPGSERGKQIKTFARVGALGIELAASTVIGLFGGQWLDGKLGTKPWLSIVGLILGVVAGFRSLYQTARSENRKLTETGPDKGSGTEPTPEPDEQDRR
jgi:ATP synthase protein I